MHADNGGVDHLHRSVMGAKAYYGEVPILGTPHITGYEPIKDGSGAQIGVYYMGYKT
jgi:Single cache domain 3